MTTSYTSHACQIIHWCTQQEGCKYPIWQYKNGGCIRFRPNEEAKEHLGKMEGYRALRTTD